MKFGSTYIREHQHFASGWGMETFERGLSNLDPDIEAGSLVSPFSEEGSGQK